MHTLNALRTAAPGRRSHVPTMNVDPNSLAMDADPADQGLGGGVLQTLRPVRQAMLHQEASQPLHQVQLLLFPVEVFHQVHQLQWCQVRLASSGQSFPSIGSRYAGLTRNPATCVPNAFTKLRQLSFLHPSNIFLLKSRPEAYAPCARTGF